MSNTVQQFAAELKKSVPTLLEQLKAAGVEKSSGADSISPYPYRTQHRGRRTGGNPPPPPRGRAAD